MTEWAGSRVSGPESGRPDASTSRSGPTLVGRRIDLEVGPVAHGGVCVARHRGQVVFVRHALPGERVRVEVTEQRSRYLRADAVQVIRAAPGRVDPPCPFAGPGRCGGCDWQHASPAVQRDLKATVVAEALRRIAGLEVAVGVEAPAGHEDGTRWRTRMRFAVDDRGRAGFHAHRSHQVIPVGECSIAHPQVSAAAVTSRRWTGYANVTVVAGLDGSAVLAHPSGGGPAQRVTGRAHVRHGAAGRSWRVPTGGFWQVHPAAADTLVDAVRDALGPRDGDAVLDLYSGVGLFAGTLAEQVGPGGRVTAVEADPDAARAARRNLHAEPRVRLVAGAVADTLAGEAGPVDLVVMDPPRAGAGRAVVELIAGLGPRRVAYVACDPAALARDVAYFAGHGYELATVRAFDLFPMTHHVECVAVLVRA